MPALSITKTYQDGDILTEADLDNIRESIEEFFNTTGIDSDNIQAGGVAASDIGINDSEYLEFGTGNDGRIGVVSDDLIIENVTTDKDIVIKTAPSGVAAETIRIDTSAANIILNSMKISGLANADTAVGTDAVNVTTLKLFQPAGLIQAYGGSTAPTGWLLCDGSAVSRTTYADLFAIIGETAGQGDNSTTFNVPDFRGRFLRGVDSGTGVDPDAAGRTAMGTGGATGDAVFSIQDDELKSHIHNIPAKQSTGGSAATSLGDTIDNSFNSAATGGNETRPKNAYVSWVIKY